MRVLEIIKKIVEKLKSLEEVYKKRVRSTNRKFYNEKIKSIKRELIKLKLVLDKERYNFRGQSKKIIQDILDILEGIYEWDKQNSVNQCIEEILYKKMPILEVEGNGENIEGNLKNFFDLLNIHPKIREVSEKWFNQKDYDVAIERSFKRIIKLVQEKSKERLDGVPLMQKVFSEKNPILAFNEGKTKTETDEQAGMMHLYMGAVFSIRNVRFHEELENDEEINSIHQIIFASFLAKRLDESNLKK